MSAKHYELHPAVLREADEAGAWYDARLAGLSFDFVESIDAALALIVSHPEAWQRDGVVNEPATRRFVMRRFPFSIVYYVVEDIVRVVAIAHVKRKPGYWRKRLRGTP